MKKILFSILIFLMFSITLKAQVKIGDNPTVINAKAALEVESTVAPLKGVLLSRITTQQMKDIPSPETGLMVFNSTLNKICVYNGTQWACTNDGSGGKKKNDNSDEGTSNDPKTRKE